MRAIHELSEPELEHHQAPEPMPVVAAPVAVLAAKELRSAGSSKMPRARNRPSSKQVVDHRRERPPQPRADRRFEPVLRAIDDRLRESAVRAAAAAGICSGRRLSFSDVGTVAANSSSL